MTLRRALLTVALAASLGAAPATAQQPDAEALAQSARAASDQLENASLALQQAVSARDRVRALTETVKAYEAGLAAMRDGLRRAATRGPFLVSSNFFQ